MQFYEQIWKELEAGRSVALQTRLTGMEGEACSSLTKTLGPAEAVTDGRGRSFARVLCEGEGDGFVISEPVLPPERLIILGGGHVGREICIFAARCGFSVTVCDDRPEFANPERFPMAEAVLCDSFENSIEKLRITKYDFVVVVTRGHVHDGICLRRILPGVFPAYLGMIGSRRRVRGMFEQMEEEGYSRQKMDAICTPIGLDIGAATPAEIGIAVAAELIAHRRQPQYTEGRPFYDSDLDSSVIEYLAKCRKPCAVATIVGTSGSAPRKAGAKMAVMPDGEIVGTIGGGLAEIETIREAVTLIGTGRYHLRVFDLSNEVAAEEGMACGGTMQVLIEDAGV